MNMTIAMPVTNYVQEYGYGLYELKEWYACI